MSEPQPYLALALQTRCIAVSGISDPVATRAAMMSSIERVGRQIAGAKGFAGPDVRLVVLPEYFLTGFPVKESAASWAKRVALAPDGPEYEALGAAARDNGAFLAGNAYELDSSFPGLHFQTSFVISPAGKVILRYRRLISLYSPSPYDVWDRYISLYGIESIFPVADTELGRLAAIASEEILYPEIGRALALRGAEVFVHSSSEIASALATPKNVAKQARAIENLAYVVSANTAGIEGIAIPASSTDASSKIVDYRGLVLAEAGFGESMAACAEIDLAGLRRYRRRPGMGNMLSRQPIGLWREALAGREAQPKNSLLDARGDLIGPSHAFYVERQKRVIEALDAAGLI
ncbi:MAG TPA: nitrilase-related carbon-nitrogen hydrolase [Steroidobacteraceae bacterium]|nr:nitrilase-related carbon-nitrogen hydrolase [Steroidobacteraceae bacterium]